MNLLATPCHAEGRGLGLEAVSQLAVAAKAANNPRTRGEYRYMHFLELRIPSGMTSQIRDDTSREETGVQMVENGAQNMAIDVGLTCFAVFFGAVWLALKG